MAAGAAALSSPEHVPLGTCCHSNDHVLSRHNMPVLSNTPPCHGRDGGSVQRNHCVLARMQHAHPRLLQEFAWAEEDIPKRRADRGSSLKADVAAELAKQPMFCFEVGPTMSVPLDDSRAQPAIHRLMHSPSVHADFMCTFADLAEDAVLEHAHLSTRGGTDALLHLRYSRPLRFLQKPRVSIRRCLYASELPIEATHSASMQAANYCRGKRRRYCYRDLGAPARCRCLTRTTL